MNKDTVSIAFKRLLEEIEALIKNLNEEGAKAFQTGNYEKAREASETAMQLKKLQEKVKALQKEWDEVFASAAPPPTRLRRGLRTPEEAFRRPILEALVELGGRAPVSKVLELVEKKMKGTLTQHDFEHLPKSGEIRWRNTAQWCRQRLVLEGLMRPGSPRGIWEISEEGRRWLQTNM